MKSLKKTCIASFTAVTLGTSTLFAGMMGFPTIDDYQERAFQYGVKLTIPDFPQTVEEIEQATEFIVSQMTASGDQLAALADEELSFANTFKALDLISHTANSKVLPINIVKNTSHDAALREAATQAMVAFQKASIAFSFREDIYLKLKTYAATDPILPSEDQKLLEDTMLEYKRLGYDLPEEERTKVEELQKKLAVLNNDFRDNIRKSNEVLTFTAEQLDGVEESFLNSVKNDEGSYSLKPNVTYHATTVAQFVKSEAVRKQFFAARASRALEENETLLKEMILTRHELAQTLGYETWADYKTEDRMAGTGTAVTTFLADLVEKLEPKFQEEYASLLALKREETGDPEAILNVWDVNYYQELQNQQKFNLDTEKIKQYFPYEMCVRGLFQVYETVFSIEITEIENPTLWDSNVSLYVVNDTVSEKPLGLFYIDPFPREGKFNHFAQFGIVPGAELADGTYQRPTVALICNFTPPEDNKPSLLTFDQVETLFHEFGHCMHSILTEAKHAKHSGTSVPRDFVETPSQIMEFWLSDKKVLDLFAAHWMDQNQRFPAEWVEKLAEAQKANAGMHYRRQLAVGSLDMAIHHTTDVENVAQNVISVTNDVTANIYLPSPEGTGWIAGIGHMAGYDAGYYGYAWADVIAADMSKVFENAPNGYMDEEAGLRLRQEVFEVGGSRDVNVSARAFLNRDPQMDAFIESLGIAPESKDSEG